MRLLLLAIFLLSAPFFASARLVHVDVGRGSDRNDGLSPAAPLRTIARAAALAQAGDEIVILPGVYMEQVVVEAKGSVERPIVFRADAVEKGRVILTRADPGIRTGKVKWSLVDETLGLYSAPFAGRNPERVLYSDVDLYPYATLEGLKTFSTAPDSPAPRHGFFLDRDARLLYVRLHPSGRYGSGDPNEHIMAVAPPGGAGFQLAGEGDHHVIIDGITFETPGNTAVAIGGNAVTIQRSWFLGCPYGVRGRKQLKDDAESGRPIYTSSNVTIAYCDFSMFPAFDDAEELLAEISARGERPKSRRPIWHRKNHLNGLASTSTNYETGLTACMGEGWKIHNNHFHDLFEALAGDGVTSSKNLEIYENLFERICDNGVETESHAWNVSIRRNLFRDVLEPFSWQPGGRPPWSGPVYFYQNVILNSPGQARLWQYSTATEGRGAFKIGVSLKNWKRTPMDDVPKSPLAATPPGLLFFNNTVVFPGGRLFTILGDRNVPIANIWFANNLLATDFCVSPDPERDLRPGHFGFRNNLVAPASPQAAGPGAIVAGGEGKMLSRVDEFGLQNLAEGDVSPVPESPASGASRPFPDMRPVFENIGALQPGDDWYPPKAGPAMKADLF